MTEKTAMVLMFAIAEGIYFLVCVAVVIFIAKNIVKWLKH